MTSNRLLHEDPLFKANVDGWLSLSGGRIGAAERAPGFGVPLPPGTERPPMRMPSSPTPTCDFSFIFAVGEYGIASLPTTSPWAEKYGARWPSRAAARRGRYRGRKPNPTTPPAKPIPRPAGVCRRGLGLPPMSGFYPDARGRRVIADVVRLKKGHTEGLEPHITEQLIKLMVSASGGKAKAT